MKILWAVALNFQFYLKWEQEFQELIFFIKSIYTLRWKIQIHLFSTAKKKSRFYFDSPLAAINSIFTRIFNWAIIFYLCKFLCSFVQKSTNILIFFLIWGAAVDEEYILVNSNDVSIFPIFLCRSFKSGDNVAFYIWVNNYCVQMGIL